MNKNAGISTLKGIGEKTEKLFLKLGVSTVDDLLHYYPRTYEIFSPPVPVSEVQEGHICTVSGAVFGRIQVSGTKNMQVTTLYLKDLTGTLKVIWFRMPFLRNTLGRSGPAEWFVNVTDWSWNIHRSMTLLPDTMKSSIPCSRYTGLLQD